MSENKDSDSDASRDSNDNDVSSYADETASNPSEISESLFSTDDPNSKNEPKSKVRIFFKILVSFSALMGLFITIAFVEEFPASMVLPLGGLCLMFLSLSISEMALVYLEEGVDCDCSSFDYMSSNEQRSSHSYNFYDYGIDRSKHYEILYNAKSTKLASDKIRTYNYQKEKIRKSRKRSSNFMYAISEKISETVVNLTKKIFGVKDVQDISSAKIVASRFKEKLRANQVRNRDKDKCKTANTDLEHQSVQAEFRSESSTSSRKATNSRRPTQISTITGLTQLSDLTNIQYLTNQRQNFVKFYYDYLLNYVFGDDESKKEGLKTLTSQFNMKRKTDSGENKIMDLVELAKRKSETR